jgi:putative ABC transport system substrate-binding protein
MLSANRSKLAGLAFGNRLPAIGSWKFSAEAGFLMSYGPEPADLFRRAATLVDKILRGAKPADLPIEQPNRFELVINLKTAKALADDPAGAAAAGR